MLVAANEPARFERLIPALVATGQFVIVGMTASAETAADEMRRLRPHVLVASVEIAVVGRPSLAEQIKEQSCTSMVLYTDASDAATMRKALHAGARDLLIEPFTVEDLVSSLLRTVGAEPSQLSPGTKAPLRSGKIVTIFGTKGGVGKSLIAANVALSAQVQSSKRCALVDLDLEFGTLAALMGITPRASIVDVCRTDNPIEPSMLDKAMYKTLDNIDLYLLAAPPTPDLAAEVEGEGRRVRSRSYVSDILSCLVSMYDYVFIDTASNFRETNLTALDLSDLVVIVTGPDIPTLQNTGKCLDILLETLNYPQQKVNLALNRADGGAGLTAADITKGLQYQIRYHLPSDGRNAVWCANCGRPLVLERPKSPLAEALNAMANSILWQLSGDTHDAKPSRSYRRKSILGWLSKSAR